MALLRALDCQFDLKSERDLIGRKLLDGKELFTDVERFSLTLNVSDFT